MTGLWDDLDLLSSFANSSDIEKLLTFDGGGLDIGEGVEECGVGEEVEGTGDNVLPAVDMGTATNPTDDEDGVWAYLSVEEEDGDKALLVGDWMMVDTLMGGVVLLDRGEAEKGERKVK